MQSKLIPFNATGRGEGREGKEKKECGGKSQLNDERNRDETLFVAESTRRKEVTKKGWKEGMEKRRKNGQRTGGYCERVVPE